MSLKKIKVSELPVCTTLTGLWTLGTDINNVSVKVSLEFLQDAAQSATSASESAEEAAKKALEAAESANTATTNANTATQNAISATSDANSATANANTATQNANTATTNANTATQNATKATEDAISATEDAVEATQRANEVLEKVVDTLTGLVPTSMEVEYPEEITYENVEPKKVVVTLYPESVMQNVLFLCDHTSIDVGLQGEITILGTGTTKVRVIPTCNTSLATEIAIKVTNKTMRLLTPTAMRFTSGGTIRFN